MKRRWSPCTRPYRPGARHRAPRSDGAGCEFVEHDLGLRGVFVRGLAKRFPHVHRRDPDARTAARAVACYELRQVFLPASRAAKPDRSLAFQVAHHHPVSGPLRMAISSTPMADVAGQGCRRSCSAIYSLSRSFTVEWCSRSERATSLTVIVRARARDVRITRRVPRVARQPVQVLHAHPAIRTAYAHPLEFKSMRNPPAPSSCPRHPPVWIEHACGYSTNRCRSFYAAVSPRVHPIAKHALEFRRRPESGNEYSSHQVRARFIDVSFH